MKLQYALFFYLVVAVGIVHIGREAMGNEFLPIFLSINALFMIICANGKRHTLTKK
ncbi:hypothetical protein [Priestia koreensis]|uniref:hypothetical protein n=1 Tax=Priestia koreensis TaxID=284581 RepID=UPI000A57104E|nr:hypothetical protein [Priestia koreensis]